MNINIFPLQQQKTILSSDLGESWCAQNISRWFLCESIHLHPKGSYVSTRTGSGDSSRSLCKASQKKLRWGRKCLFFYFYLTRPVKRGYCGLSSDQDCISQQSSWWKWTEEGFSTQQNLTKTMRTISDISVEQRMWEESGSQEIIYFMEQ